MASSVAVTAASAAPQLTTLAVLLAGLITVSVMAVSGTLWLARLLFRARIEAIRADLVSAVLDGTLSQHPAVTACLATRDELARHTRWSTARLIAEALAGDDTRARDAPELPPGEQEILAGLLARMLAAIGSYLAWGNPGSWHCSLRLHAARLRRHHARPSRIGIDPPSRRTTLNP